MMASKFKFIMYYDINYTSLFWVKIGFPILCFHSDNIALVEISQNVTTPFATTCDL
jgi:hypothetical protein